MRTDFVLDALEQALYARQPGRCHEGDVKVVGSERLELSTYGLRVRCSTN